MVFWKDEGFDTFSQTENFLHETLNSCQFFSNIGHWSAVQLLHCLETLPWGWHVSVMDTSPSLNQRWAGEERSGQTGDMTDRGRWGVVTPVSIDPSLISVWDGDWRLVETTSQANIGTCPHLRRTVWTDRRRILK